jgi:hypothetical protein
VHADDHEAVPESVLEVTQFLDDARQLMQQKVQKSSTTTRPRRSRRDSGMSVLIHPPAPRSSGARTRPVAVVMARPSSRVSRLAPPARLRGEAR